MEVGVEIFVGGGWEKRWGIKKIFRHGVEKEVAGSNFIIIEERGKW